MWGLPWAVIQRMMIDSPKYDYKKTGESGKDKKVKLTKDNAEEIKNYINSLK